MSALGPSFQQDSGATTGSMIAAGGGALHKTERETENRHSTLVRQGRALRSAEQLAADRAGPVGRSGLSPRPADRSRAGQPELPVAGAGTAANTATRPVSNRSKLVSTRSQSADPLTASLAFISEYTSTAK